MEGFYQKELLLFDVLQGVKGDGSHLDDALNDELPVGGDT